MGGPKTHRQAAVLRVGFLFRLALALALWAACRTLITRISFFTSARAENSPFSFVVAADMRYFSGPGAYDTGQYFRGAVEAIAALGGGGFMITPGDIDPPGNVLWTIEQKLGTLYRWYPVLGNHELPGAGVEPISGANLAWLNSFDYGNVNPGPAGCPKTTFSFDYGNAHFVALNVYCDSTGDAATSGDITDHLFYWLENDLSATDKDHIFVIGHEPAFPQPDADNRRLRHLGDSLDQYPSHRDRFWNLLGAKRVVAYICGHTHNYSAVKLNGVWQLDAGHARGLGDSGTRSTFILVRLQDDQLVGFDVYRDGANGGAYTRLHQGLLRAPHEVSLPVLSR